MCLILKVMSMLMITRCDKWLKGRMPLQHRPEPHVWKLQRHMVSSHTSAFSEKEMLSSAWVPQWSLELHSARLKPQCTIFDGFGVRQLWDKPIWARHCVSSSVISALKLEFMNGDGSLWHSFIQISNLHSAASIIRAGISWRHRKQNIMLQRRSTWRCI